ncbi:hypothetical protein NMG60_11007670 [Bertholletia excelsa]
MVWGLFPVDPLPGEDRYYILSKGTYKVGRKGCDVIINKDKGVSRIHAEIVVDGMASLEHMPHKSSNMSSSVRIRDFSKYGTFINKNLGSSEKVHELPNKEAFLKDGDLVSFGTGNATYRFCFVPFVFFVYCSEPVDVIQEKISSIGAQMTQNWVSDCTHVLVNNSMPVTENVIDAFVAKKPFLLKDWIEIFAEKNMCTEIPSYTSYAPTFMFEGVPVKAADPKSRETSLRGYTFLLDSTHKYKFRGKLWSLLEMVGAKVVSVEGFCSNSQGLEEEEDNKVVLVTSGLEDKFVSSRNLSAVSRVREVDLVCAAFSGHLDPSIIVAAPVIVSSSCSTDETVVADSDVEAETARSIDITAVVKETEISKHESKEEFPEKCAAIGLCSGYITSSSYKGDTIGVTRDRVDEHKSGNQDNNSSDRDNIMTIRRDHNDEPESGNPDIIYSQNLIVRDTNSSASVYPSTDNEVPNFKCFRKRTTPSGNSFNNLIPFSKYPYKDSDYGSDEVDGYIKEEKQRKQMEAIAEDLFNNEKGRRRGVAGSLHGLLTRR